jgi:hypothetical protein
VLINWALTAVVFTVTSKVSEAVPGVEPVSAGTLTPVQVTVPPASATEYPDREPQDADDAT